MRNYNHLSSFDPFEIGTSFKSLFRSFFFEMFFSLRTEGHDLESQLGPGGVGKDNFLGFGLSFSILVSLGLLGCIRRGVLEALVGHKGHF